MNFNFLHFSKNEDHQFFDIVFKLNSYEFYLMLHYDLNCNYSLSISFDGIISYHINHFDLCHEIFQKHNTPSEIEHIILKYLDYFEPLHSDILNTDKKIDLILSNPLIKHFHDNFLELKDNHLILQELQEITHQFILEHRKYHKPNPCQWNYLYTEKQQYSLFTLAYFSEEIKDCQFFIDSHFLKTPLFFHLLKKFNIGFFHQDLHYFHYVVNFSKDVLFYSLDEYVEYFLIHFPVRFSEMYFELIGNIKISDSDFLFFTKKFISIYNDSFFHLHSKVVSAIDFHFYTIQFLEYIIQEQQKITNPTPHEISSFVDKIRYVITTNQDNNKSHSFYTFSLLNDDYSEKVIHALTYFNIHNFINELIDYKNQKHIIDNF